MNKDVAYLIPWILQFGKERKAWENIYREIGHFQFFSLKINDYCLNVNSSARVHSRFCSCKLCNIHQHVNKLLSFLLSLFSIAGLSFRPISTREPVDRLKIHQNTFSRRVYCYGRSFLMYDLRYKKRFSIGFTFILVKSVWVYLSISFIDYFIRASLKEPRSESVRRWLFGGSPTVPPSVRPFFVGGMRPQGLPGTRRQSAKEIQQKLQGEPPATPPYFVSLFDKERNIALYSAYIVTPSQAQGIDTSGVSGKKDAPTHWQNPPGIC